MGQYWCFGTAHLSFDGKLGSDIEVPDQTSQETENCSRDGEDRRHDYHCDKLRHTVEEGVEERVHVDCNAIVD